jgi:hypothetical protein
MRGELSLSFARSSRHATSEFAGRVDRKNDGAVVVIDGRIGADFMSGPTRTTTIQFVVPRPEAAANRASGPRNARFGLVGVFCAVTSAFGCAFFSPAAPHKPVRFTEAPAASSAERFPNWSMAPALSQEDLLIFDQQRGDYKVLSYGGAGAGTSGAEQRLIAAPGLGPEVKFKVKAMTKKLDGVNNAPRKELASYFIQHLFLDPEDFVVPTSFPFCISMEMWRMEHEGKGERNVKGLDCVLVLDSLWLVDVTLPDVLYDEEHFLSEPSYAYYMSNLNVFTYLADHQDGRDGNFLVSKDARRQVFAIDNGVSFGQPWPFYNWFVANWNVIRVAAVRRDSVDRLRKLERSDLDFLLVASQLEVDAEGIAHQVLPGPSLDDDEGAVHRGDTIQLGLTRGEIDDVWKRIRQLIADADSGDLPVF